MRAPSLSLLSAIATSVFILAGAASAMEVSGPAVIIDCDTLVVAGQEVRIQGIDAPETNQKCQLPKGTWGGLLCRP